MTQAFNLSQLANNVNTSGQLNAATSLYNQVPVANGGTGLATLTANAVIIGNGTSAVTSVAASTLGNVLTSDGTTWVSQVASGGTPIVRIYSSPSPWTKPSTIKAVKVTLVAGGGSGGSSDGPVTNVAGGGGNGGILYGYAQSPAIPGPVTVTVGTGGSAPGRNVAGVSGGTSSFGSVFSTTGGVGGGGGPSSAGPGASGGAYAITSTSTTSSLQLTSPIPVPVNGYGVHGTPSATSGVAGTPGTGYGMGGGSAQGTSLGGGAGSAGFVIVEEFY